MIKGDIMCNKQEFLEMFNECLRDGSITFDVDTYGCYQKIYTVVLDISKGQGEFDRYHIFNFTVSK